jgi:hypothetical protein
MAMRVLGPTLVMLFTCTVALAQENPGKEAAPVANCALSMIDVQQKMPASVEGNELLPVEILVANNGPVAVENVMVLETLPPFTDLVDATPPPEQLRGKLAWPLGTLAPGGQRVIHLRLKCRTGASNTELRNIVNVVFQTSVSHSAVAVVKRPVVTLDISGPKTSLVGETLSCQITARNRGNTTAHQLRLETRLAAGLSHPGGDDLE